MVPSGRGTRLSSSKCTSEVPPMIASTCRKISRQISRSPSSGRFGRTSYHRTSNCTTQSRSTAVACRDIPEKMLIRCSRYGKQAAQRFIEAVIPFTVSSYTSPPIIKVDTYCILHREATIVDLACLCYVLCQQSFQRYFKYVHYAMLVEEQNKSFKSCKYSEIHLPPDHQDILLEITISSKCLPQKKPFHPSRALNP